jgi:hypothetical protein
MRLKNCGRGCNRIERIEEAKMSGEDEQFEKYLSEFQPRRPRALPAAPARTPAWLWGAAAAVLVIVLGTYVWVLHRANVAKQWEFSARNVAGAPSAKVEQSERSVLRLTRLAEEDPQRFEAELADASRRVLPNFRGKDSTLRVLAEE